MDTPAARAASPAAALPVAGKAAAKSGMKEKPGYQRVVEVGLRSLHIVAMALVLGGIPLGGTWHTLKWPIVATVLTGALLLVTSLRWGCLHLSQGGGFALLVKFALLGLGNVFEGARLEWYAAATLVTSVGSHMTSSWRHFPVFAWLLSLGRPQERAP
jgi:hypothetical protein